MTTELLNKIRERNKWDTKDFTTGQQIKLACDYPTTDFGKKKKVYEYNVMCPCCNSNNMHQGNVGIYNRVEDAETGTHVEVDGDKVTVDKDLTGNPSKRRQGISIVMSCEECGSDNILNIYQHKGLTLMSWE